MNKHKPQVNINLPIWVHIGLYTTWGGALVIDRLSEGSEVAGSRRAMDAP